MLEDTFAVSETTVPEGVLPLTLSLRVKLAVAPEARVPIVAVMPPVLPTAGVLHDHPEAQESEANVAYPGDEGIDSV